MTADVTRRPILWTEDGRTATCAHCTFRVTAAAGKDVKGLRSEMLKHARNSHQDVVAVEAGKRKR